MKKIAIFGNAGAGKSTLAKSLSEATGLPLHSVDKLKFRKGGAEIPHDDYLHNHRAILENEEAWIIDGFGCPPSAWERFGAADTLIYLDLALWRHALWVTKRFFLTFAGMRHGVTQIESSFTLRRAVCWAAAGRMHAAIFGRC